MSADREAVRRAPFGLTDMDCRALAAVMRQAGVRFLDVEGHGQRLRLKLEEPDRVMAAPTETAELATLIKANSLGRFRAAHPDGLFPACPIGAAVERAQILGFLQIGTLLLPVTAPRAGRLACVIATDGDVVGYGTLLFEINHGSSNGA